jgi:hypothetical protein
MLVAVGAPALGVIAALAAVPPVPPDKKGGLGAVVFATVMSLPAAALVGMTRHRALYVLGVAFLAALPFAAAATALRTDDAQAGLALLWIPVLGLPVGGVLLGIDATLGPREGDPRDIALAVHAAREELERDDRSGRRNRARASAERAARRRGAME